MTRVPPTRREYEAKTSPSQCMELNMNPYNGVGEGGTGEVRVRVRVRHQRSGVVERGTGEVDLGWVEHP
jgi:hypothetical protein